MDVFTLIHLTGPNRGIAIFMICYQAVAYKVFNVKWHYEISHKSFDEKFHTDSEHRRSKIENQQTKYKSVIQILSHTMTEQQKCAEASLQIL